VDLSQQVIATVKIWTGAIIAAAIACGLVLASAQILYGGVKPTQWIAFLLSLIMAFTVMGPVLNIHEYEYTDEVGKKKKKSLIEVFADLRKTPVSLPKSSCRHCCRNRQKAEGEQVDPFVDNYGPEVNFCVQLWLWMRKNLAVLAGYLFWETSYILRWFMDLILPAAILVLAFSDGDTIFLAAYATAMAGGGAR